MAQNCNSRVDLRQVHAMNVDELTHFIRNINKQLDKEKESKDNGNQEPLA